MSKKIEVAAIINKITRINGKADAQMIVVIPMTASTEIPMGKVVISISEQQQTMFNKPFKGAKSQDEE